MLRKSLAQFEFSALTAALGIGVSTGGGGGGGGGAGALVGAMSTIAILFFGLFLNRRQVCNKTRTNQNS